MPNPSKGIKVPRERGETLRRALAEMGLLDRERKIASDEAYVYLPVLSLGQEDEARLRNLSDLAVVERPFEAEERARTPESILGYNPCFEVIGDIAIVEPKDAPRVAEALLSTSPHLKSVVTPASDVEGEFRTRRFERVAGVPRTFTVHRENGLKYKLDLEKVYFSPRLATERLRVAGQVYPGDLVLDMFAGVGPFALLLAKRGARVVAIDKNPWAVKYLVENAALNKIEGVEVLEGDAACLASSYEGSADHVIMNLPHSASRFLLPAIRAARKGGIIHYYAFAPENDLYGDVNLIEKAAAEARARVEVLYKGVVRSYAPRVYNIAIDFEVIKD